MKVLADVLLFNTVSRKIKCRTESAILIQKWVRMFLAIHKYRPRSVVFCLARKWFCYFVAKGLQGSQLGLGLMTPQCL